jgi:hypothetical protein
MSKLDLVVVQSQLPKNQRPMVDESVLEEIQKLAEDPDYGEEFLDTYIDHLNVLKNVSKRTHDQYLNAVKFFSLVEGGHSLTDAYIKVFPDRFRTRKKGSSDPDKSVMRADASRYNNTMLVNEIRKAATIPVQLIHRHLLHEAILEQANLMRNARSEMVRQKAADTLIRELKPAEEHTLKLDVNDGASSVIEELRKATERLAAAEHQSVMAGVPLKTIAESRIHEPETIEDVDYEEVPDVETDASPIVEGSKDTQPASSQKKRWQL